jgi:hypothetical protein
MPSGCVAAGIVQLRRGLASRSAAKQPGRRRSCGLCAPRGSGPPLRRGSGHMRTSSNASRGVAGSPARRRNAGDGRLELVDRVRNVGRIAAGAGDLALELRTRPHTTVAGQEQHHHCAFDLARLIRQRLATFCGHGMAFPFRATARGSSQQCGGQQRSIGVSPCNARGAVASQAAKAGAKTLVGGRRTYSRGPL